MELKLGGKRAIVTGSSRGIGRACAESLAAEGCSVVLVARSGEALELVKRDIVAQYDVDVVVHAADLTDSNAIDEMIARHGDSDILVNNAGDIPGGSVEDFDERSWAAGWQLKVFGYLNATRQMLEVMYARGSGVIINVIGIGGVLQHYEYAAGAAGNAGLMAFTHAVGSRSIDRGVRVVAVNPGAIDTDRWREMRAMNDVSNRPESAASNGRYLETDLPAGRPGAPRELADVVTFLASERASYVSGTTVTVDGGLTFR